MAVNLNGKPMDFSFMSIEQYDSAVHISQFDSFSKLLDFFYQERDQIERMRGALAGFIQTALQCIRTSE